jgi:CheY-like chemotaxis protein
MTVQERIELLKSNILHYAKDLLQFDVVEIRLLDQQTSRLEPLLAEGMQPEAEARILYARPEHNGVTGFVAATGRSYFCVDTTKDPLYLEGCKGAKSSLTVPLMLHDQVIGTFNVESPEPGGFTETDLQFLEIFSRDVAAALNTLELLVAEKASTAAESIEAIHGAVALPVDDILNDAVNVMERYIGHDADVVERLQRILRNARDIKQVIQKVGEKMAPSSAHTQSRQAGRRPVLTGRRLLVVDADAQVRAAAHALLERYACIVETARDGAEAASMVRAALGREAYDVIISDIRLPDMSGYQLLLRLQEILEHVPLVLMTGFGYDPGHSIVKARQAGIDLVLFKPFRVDQLLDTVERALSVPKIFATNANDISVPAETPDEVNTLPSSTQRALSAQSTLPLWFLAIEKKALLEVARKPSKIPALANNAEPVQTEVVQVVSACRICKNAIIFALRSWAIVPFPPGTSKISIRGASSNEYVATVANPWADRTGPLLSATVNKSNSVTLPHISTGP